MTNNFIGAFSESTLNALPRPAQGEYALNKDTQKMMIYDGEKWIYVDTPDLSLSLLELNRNVISQLPVLTESEIQEKISDINNFRVKTDNIYYMLYGKEISYFTVFAVAPNGECNSLGDGVIECLKNVSHDIYAIDLTEDHNAYEIWIKNSENDEASVLYLFPYDSGIVTIGG